jgi:hypothetical protein
VTVFTTEDDDTTLHDANWLGASVWWSAGWTRYYPLLVTHFYPRWFWVPDIDQDEFGNKFAVYPPEVTNFEDFGCFGTGSGGGSGWFKREASTGYKVYTQRGEALDNSRDFVPGDVVRFDGDNWHEPGTGQTVKDGDDAEDLPFWDRQFTGKHKRQIQPRILDDLLFTVTDSTKYSVTDSSKDWWRDWYEGGTLATHNFTAQAGSTTTFETEDTWGDDGNANSCWFKPEHFTGWDAAFKDFILEIDKVEHNPETDEDETITYKVPVTDVTLDGTMQVIHFAAVDRKYGGGSLTVTAGMNGRIREPDSKVNRYRGHRVEITDPSGNLVEVDCLLSDDQTLFFAARSEPFPVGSTGKIIEYYPGGCWEFRTTAPTDEEKAAGIKWQKIDTDKYFVQVHGDDPRGEPWHAEMTENEPDAAPIDFGRFCKGDYVWFGLLNEMYVMENRLRHWHQGGSWATITYWEGIGDTDGGTDAETITDNGSGHVDYPAATDSDITGAYLTRNDYAPVIFPVDTGDNDGTYDITFAGGGTDPPASDITFSVKELNIRSWSSVSFFYDTALSNVTFGYSYQGFPQEQGRIVDGGAAPYAYEYAFTYTEFDGSAWLDPYADSMPHGWDISFHRAAAHLTATPPVLMAYAVDFYEKSRIPANPVAHAGAAEFDANGDDVVDESSYFHKFDTASYAVGTPAGAVWSARLGNTLPDSAPNSDEPTLPTFAIGYDSTSQDIDCVYQFNGDMSSLFPEMEILGAYVVEDGSNTYEANFVDKGDDFIKLDVVGCPGFVPDPGGGTLYLRVKVGVMIGYEVYAQGVVFRGDVSGGFDKIA